MGAAVKYLQDVGFDAIQKQETLLNECITDGIRDIQGLKMIGPADPKLRGGIVTFYIDGIDSHRDRPDARPDGGDHGPLGPALRALLVPCPPDPGIGARLALLL